MSILPKAIYRFNTTHFKIPRTFFHRNRTKNSKKYIELQKTPNSQSNPEKEKVGDSTLSDFKLYYKAIVIKTYGIGRKTDT